ncbi:MAG: winged helix-turn-helix transcriptional regulator [Candidatus Helarchaeota archaeon]
MKKREKSKKSHYRNVLLEIFDAWYLFNQEIPQRIEADRQKDAVREERKRKLDPKYGEQDRYFSPSEVAIINQLISNPRRTYLELSEQLELSRRTVKKKIENMLIQEKIQFAVSVNYQKLNLDFIVLTITPNTIKALEELADELDKCPLVFLIIKDLSRNLLQLLVGAEKSTEHSNLYTNFVENLQLDERVKECTVISLNPEITPKYLLFTLKNQLQQNKRAPCGKNCIVCSKYITKKCRGCPAIEWYQGSIFRMARK